MVTKLTKEVVLACISACDDGENLETLSEKYGVKKQHLRSRIYQVRKQMEMDKSLNMVNCALCNNLNDVNSIYHHTSYFPEEVVKVHNKCHQMIHKGYAPTWMLPPLGDSKVFYSNKGEMNMAITIRISKLISDDVKKISNAWGTSQSETWRRFYRIAKAIFFTELTLGELINTIPSLEIASARKESKDSGEIDLCLIHEAENKTKMDRKYGFHTERQEKS